MTDRLCGSHALAIELASVCAVFSIMFLASGFGLSLFVCVCAFLLVAVMFFIALLVAVPVGGGR